MSHPPVLDRPLKAVAILSDVHFDGADYALRLNSPRLWEAALSQHVQEWQGQKVRWGWFLNPKDPRVTSMQGYWRLTGTRLDATADVLHQRMTRAAAIVGCKPLESVDDFYDHLHLARERNNPQLFTAGLTIKIYQLSDFSVYVVCGYHSGIQARFLAIDGFYIRDAKAWILPFRSAQNVKEILLELGFTEEQVLMHEGIYRFDDANKSIAQLSDDERTDWEISLSRRGGIFDELDPINEIEALEDEGLIYVDEDAAEEAASDKQRFFRGVTSRMQTLPCNEEHLTSFMQAAAANYRENKPNFVDYLPVQDFGIRYMAERSTMLLADDMGLGKTIQAAVAAAYRAKLAGKKVLVVTSKSATDTAWRTTILEGFPLDNVVIGAWSDDADWIVLNYERLKVLNGHEHEFEVVVFDEAHRANKPGSLCTDRAFAIAHKTPIRYLVTGTPVLNNYGELHTLLRLSGHPIGDIPARDFIKYMDEVPFRKAVHAYLRTTWLLRRLKKDHLPIPPKHRHHIWLKLSKAQRQVYENILDERRSGLVGMPLLHALKRFLGDVKIEYINKELKKLKKSQKALVFCLYDDHITTLEETADAQGAGYVTITGSKKDHERTSAQTEFQTNPSVRRFFGNVKAAGESITLTAGQRVYFTLLPWTKGALSQAEDRAWRNGVQHEVDIIIPLVEDTIDEKLLQIVEAKGEMEDDLFTATVEDEKSNMEAVLSAARLLKNK